MNEETQPAAAGKRLSWSPFQPLRTEAAAASAARSAMAVVAFLVISYVFQVLIVASAGRDTFGNAGGGVLVSDTICVLLATWLGYRVWSRQGVWSAIILAVWYAFELVGKFLAITGGQQTTNGGFIVMFVAIAASAILGVRGAWKLRSLRRATAPIGASAE